MKITHLEIKDKEYKNLNIDLKENKSGIMAFIGNNGSGKSNLLESLSIIFKNLYTRKDKEIPFSFSISYLNSGSTDKITITKQKTTMKYYVNDVVASDVYNKLPKQIVAIYSGEENRLWKNWYKPIYDDYIANITSGKSTGIGSYNDFPKMLYINKFYWHISLLCLLLQKRYDEADNFCTDVLNIQKVHTVKFTFNKGNYTNYTNSNVKQFIQVLDSKEEYTLEELNDILDAQGYTIADAYKYLYIAFTPDKQKMVEDIVIKYNDDHLEIEHFSEGEKKMLLIKSALEFAGAEDSLFILDEPDAHIHLNNKIQIKKVFERYINNRQVVLTTHSPTLTDTLEEDALYMLNQGKLVSQAKQEILENVSGEFWNKFQQNAYISTTKQIIILVEGMEDKTHITNAYEKLNDEYDIDFAIFNMGGADNIEHFVKGIYSSELKNDRLHICILDNDEKGIDVCKNLNTSFKNMSNFNVFLYPKKQVNPSHDGSFTVENMFEPKLYENAYKQVLQDFSFEYKSIDKISTNIQTKAKGRLAGLSSGFNKEDFNNFKIIFDKINNHFNEHKNTGLKVKTDKVLEKNETTSIVEVPNSKETQLVKPTVNKDFIEVYTSGKGVEAVGEFYPPNTLVVKTGSKIVQKATPTFTGKETRNKLIKKCIEKNADGNWILKEDIKFNTPSGAINFVMGSNLNGWDYWYVKETNKSLQTERKK